MFPVYDIQFKPPKGDLGSMKAVKNLLIMPIIYDFNPPNIFFSSRLLILLWFASTVAISINKRGFLLQIYFSQTFHKFEKL